ncbi:MAG: nitroreductase family deazaflavin-dependent oxidoreductase [Actinobacteria bacterium]|nr:nitroreductase family deazaflavin-dependent oxidoreductase [Actinomycetota bacterium]
MNEFNQKIIDEFRANEGKVGGMFEGAPLLLLHTTGAKSGKERIAPLAYGRDGDHVVVFGSKAGAPMHPDWFHNLVANPRVTVEIGTEQYAADARVTEGEERERIWEKQKRDIPNFNEYEKLTERQIPVIVLERV